MPKFRRLSAFPLVLLLLSGTAAPNLAHAVQKPPPQSAQQPQGDSVFADFEGNNYGGWTSEGTAFGAGPALGTLPQQMTVSGYQGGHLVNSFVGGDAAAGRLISPEFRITRKFIAFLIGGGGWQSRTCVNLVVGGKTARTATGPNTAPGGSERLSRSGWDVQKLRGQSAHLEIVDAATGGWGHIMTDQITFTDTQPPLAPQMQTDVSQVIASAGPRLNIPIKNGAPRRTVTLRIDGKVVQSFQAPLADETPDWWSFVDVGQWKNKPLTVTVDTLPENSKALFHIASTVPAAGQDSGYREPLRPQFHFSARRGWLNDPNGLVWANGEYHLFFQHSPFDWGGALKYWGHAVSPDLVHWTEVEEALEPDKIGDMWSGSGVFDVNNTSGFASKDGKAPLVLIYTAAGQPFTQCIAWSMDARHFTKYAKNPVVGNVTAGNRDPRVFWYAPTQHWVMALYVEENGKHTIHFLTSPNLRDWTPASVFPGQPGTNFLYECPDIFPLPLDGNDKKTKWILTGADTQYVIGSFDGKKFTPESSILPGVLGRGFYAPQTFNDGPQHRRVQIGWWRTETPGMPFNQSMSTPLELALITTKNGMKLTYAPVKELESLRATAHTLGAVTVSQTGGPDPLAGIHAELVEIRAEFTPVEASVVTFTVRGITVVYDSKKEELIVNGHHAYAPLLSGKQRLTIYADRTGLEVFASDGLCYVPMPVNLNPDDTILSLTVKGVSAGFNELTVYELKSAWR